MRLLTKLEGAQPSARDFGFLDEDEEFNKLIIVEFRDTIVQAKSLRYYKVLADETTPGVSSSPSKNALPPRLARTAGRPVPATRESVGAFSPDFGRPLASAHSPQRAATAVRAAKSGSKEGVRKSFGDTR